MLIQPSMAGATGRPAIRQIALQIAPALFAGANHRSAFPQLAPLCEPTDD